MRKTFLKIIIILIGLTLIPMMPQTMAEDVEQQLNTEIITISQKFSKPLINENEDYAKITIAEAESWVANPGAPKLPMFTKTLEFPAGTKILNIETTHSTPKTMMLSKKIQPISTPVISTDKEPLIKEELNQYVYSSNDIYPSTFFSYETGMGINKNGEQKLQLFLRVNPVCYIPTSNEVEYIEDIQLKINYIEPEPETTPLCVYDMLIITPQEYKQNLTKLVEHKNYYGIKTNLITLETIYNTTQGRDKQEQIKYYIKKAYDEWHIKYVLLVGDVQKLPIRTVYSNWWEPDTLSDLYYSDLYNSEYEFCSWDANNNNKFGECNISYNMTWPPEIDDIDKVDLCADVHIGRLACVNKEEVDTMVRKIITYENETYDTVWSKKIILAGGDTFPPAKFSRFNHFEGEITNTQVAQQIPDFDAVKLWTSQRNLNFMTFNKAINQGALFLDYAGHGFEYGWGTYRPNSIRGKMGFFTQPMYFTPFVNLLKNENRLPIIFFDACLTAKLDFNITDFADYYPFATKLVTLFTRVKNDPSIFFPCFAWSFLKKENGGAIATVGSTRTAYSMVSMDGVEGGAGLLDVEFFKAYGQKDITILGGMLTEAQRGYIEKLGKDFFTIEEYILLGDPSLKVGGYP